MPDRPQLKYLFVAAFTDETSYTQTPLDQHPTDPKRSEYTYLQEYIAREKKTIRRFSLVGDNHIVSVDLATGMFAVDGLELTLESKKLPAMPEQFVLVFYRQWTRERHIKYVLNEALQPEVVSTVDDQPFCEYFIGWECVVGGETYIQKMAVA